MLVHKTSQRIHQVVLPLLASLLLVLPATARSQPERDVQPVPTADRLCRELGDDLVVNGDFELGDTGFSSSLQHDGLGSLPTGRYDVISDANTKNGFWQGKNHVPANGRLFLALDPATKAGAVAVWKQTVTVVPGATYQLSAWLLNLWPDGTGATVRFAVDAQNGPTFVASPTTWQRHVWQWTAPASFASVELRIEVLNPQAIGHDLGIDGISFAPCCRRSSAAFSPLLDACTGAPLSAHAVQGAGGALGDWQLAVSDETGKPLGPWIVAGWGLSVDLTGFTFEPGKCYVIRHHVQDSCCRLSYSDQVVCPRRVSVFLPGDCATDAICARLHCEPGEEPFQAACGCGCRAALGPIDP